MFESLHEPMRGQFADTDALADQRRKAAGDLLDKCRRILKHGARPAEDFLEKLRSRRQKRPKMAVRAGVLTGIAPTDPLGMSNRPAGRTWFRDL